MFNFSDRVYGNPVRVLRGFYTEHLTAHADMYRYATNSNVSWDSIGFPDGSKQHRVSIFNIREKPVIILKLTYSPCTLSGVTFL